MRRKGIKVLAFFLAAMISGSSVYGAKAPEREVIVESGIVALEERPKGEALSGSEELPKGEALSGGEGLREAEALSGSGELLETETTPEGEEPSEQELLLEVEEVKKADARETWTPVSGASGSCGVGPDASYVIWRLYENTVGDYKLQIGGRYYYQTGYAMADYTSSSEAPWHEYCSKIKEAVIETGVASIGDRAFYGCSSLEEVSIGANVTSMGTDAFYGCTSIQEILVDSGNSAYTAEDGILYNKGKTTLLLYPAGKEDAVYVAPQSITIVAARAFSGCSSLQKIVFAKEISFVGAYAFSGCSSLQKVYGYKSRYTALYNYCLNNSLEFQSLDQGIAVKCDANGGTVGGTSGISDQCYPAYPYQYNGSDSVVRKLPTAEREGYVFGGWYTEKEGGEKITADSIVKNPEAHTLYAHWVVAEGDCGSTSNGSSADLLSWRLEENTKGYRLIIDGKARMADYDDASDTPWYFWRGKINAVTIEEGVLCVGARAFYGCTGLTSVNIPKGVTSIGSNVFEGCSSLESITIPEGVTSIEARTFYGCSRLGSIVIPEGVTSIGSQAFYDCIGLENITIPEGVTSIRSQAFYGCISLVNITIPEGVTNIGSYAFYRCSMKEIHIPASVSAISSNAFSCCTKLESFSVAVGNSSYMAADGVLYDIFRNNGKTMLNCYPAGKKDKIFVAPVELNAVRWGAFSGCDSLQLIVFAKEISSMDVSSIADCGALKTIYGYTTNSTAVQEYCSKNGLTFQNLDDGVTVTFDANGGKIEGKYDQWTPTVYPAYAYSYRTDDSTLTFRTPENGDYTFGGWYTEKTGGRKITEDTLVTNPTAHTLYARWYVKSGSASAPESDVSWNLTMEGCLTVSGTGNMADFGAISDAPWFDQKAAVKKIVIEEGIERIGDYAFEGFVNLEEVSMPESLTAVGAGAFSDCTKLQKLYFPQNVSSVGSDLLKGADALEKVYGYTQNSSAVKNYCDENGIAFGNLDQGIKITLEYNGGSGSSIFYVNRYRPDVYGELPTPARSGYQFGGWYTSDGEMVFQNTEITLWENHTLYAHWEITGTCGSTAQSGSKESDVEWRLTEEAGGYRLIISPSAQKADYSVYMQNYTEETDNAPWYAYRDKIKAVSIDGTVCSIGSRAFLSCSVLEEVIWNGGYVRTIGEAAFSGCGSLKRIDIPSGVTSLEDFLFMDCNGLEEITLPERVTSIGESVFSGCGSLEKIPLTNSITSIGSCAFEESGLVQIILPAKMSRIEAGTFQNCERLMHVTIPKGIAEVGANAFAGCTAIEELAFPESVAAVGEEMLAGCTKLKTVYGYSGNNSVKDYCSQADITFVDMSNVGIQLTYDSNGGDMGTIVQKKFPLETYGEFPQAAKSGYTLGGWYTAKEGGEKVTAETVISQTKDHTVYAHWLLGAGACGSAARWEIVEENGGHRLNISGTNHTGSYSSGSEVPWHENRDKITDITVENGVTSIGGYLFFGCSGVTELELPESVEEIRRNAFSGCSNLETLSVAAERVSVGEDILEGCTSLKAVYGHAGTDLEAYCKTKGIAFVDIDFVPVETEKPMETEKPLETEKPMETEKPLESEAATESEYMENSEQLPLSSENSGAVMPSSENPGGDTTTPPTNPTPTPTPPADNPADNTPPGDSTQQPTPPAATPVGDIPKVKVKVADASTVQLSWGKIKGAKGYTVYRSNSANKGFKKLNKKPLKGSVTSYTDKKLNKKKTYYYKVEVKQTVKGKTYTNVSAVLKWKVPALPGKPKAELSAKGGSDVMLTWGTVKKAQKIEIYRAVDNGKFKLWKTLPAQKKNYIFSFSNLKKGSRYKYKTRAYYVKNGTKIYGSYSKDYRSAFTIK